MNEARAQVIWRHIAAFINGTGTSWPTFCADVSEHYCDAVPEHARKIEFSRHRDVYQRMLLNAQTVRRFEHDNKFGLPADLEESVVLSLPAERRQALQTELSARTQLLATPIPEHGGPADTLSIATLMRETGEAITAIAPMLQDGKIDYRDAPLANNAEQEILQAMAALNNVLIRVKKIQEPKKTLKQAV